MTHRKQYPFAQGHPDSGDWPASLHLAETLSYQPSHLTLTSRWTDSRLLGQNPIGASLDGTLASDNCTGDTTRSPRQRPDLHMNQLLLAHPSADVTCPGGALNRKVIKLLISHRTE